MAGGRREAVWDFGNKLGSGRKTGLMTDRTISCRRETGNLPWWSCISSKVLGPLITTSSGSLTYIGESKGMESRGLYEMSQLPDRTVIGAGQTQKAEIQRPTPHFWKIKPYQNITLEERADLLAEENRKLYPAGQQAGSVSLWTGLAYDMVMEMGLAYSRPALRIFMSIRI